MSGFTLMELMIAVTIAGILFSLAIPSFNNAIANSRLTSNANAMIGAINYARSEAVARGKNVAIVPVGLNSWQVVVVGLSTEELRRFEPPQGDISITTLDFESGITYQQTGYRPFPSTQGTITICDTKRGLGKLVTVEASGSVSIKDLTSC
ncbi:MAG: GspH/FimT family pseudopilin [Gammaproteobacteria bacterium]|nr:GspH/FimT family pseudopilin [Gammaproteobacteria bacterium]MDH5629554.1 GspH/FimT family pseudopilin [Gammaproteobacteria bacterium]